MWAEFWSKVRPIVVPVALLGALVWSLWFAFGLAWFTAGLLLAVWGVRVQNERTFEEEFAMWMKSYGSRG